MHIGGLCRHEEPFVFRDVRHGSPSVGPSRQPEKRNSELQRAARHHAAVTAIAPAITAPIEIGDDVFIGARAIIMKGITLGAEAVAVAGVVVAKAIPARAIVAVNPANPLGTVGERCGRL